MRARTIELQKLSSNLENIQNSLNQGMVIVDRDLCITHYTPLAVRVFCLVEDDIGKPLLGIPTTVPLPGLRAALVDVLAGAFRRNIEAESEEMSYLAQVLPYQEQEGQRIGAIITLTDVSELLALRRAAETSLDAFTDLTDALEEAVWKRDAPMGRLLYASQRILPLTGWSPGELSAQPERLDEVIVAEDRERVQACRDVSSGGWSMSYRILRRDGQQRWIRENAKVLSEELGGCVVGTLSDVTVQRQAAEQGRELSLLFETLIRSSSFSLALFDASQRVVMVNGSLCRRIGFDRESLLGSPASLFCELPQAIAEGASPEDEPLLVSETIPVRHRDGHTVMMPAELWRLPASVARGSLLMVLPTARAPGPEGVAPSPQP